MDFKNLNIGSKLKNVASNITNKITDLADNAGEALKRKPDDVSADEYDEFDAMKLENSDENLDFEIDITDLDDDTDDRRKKSSGPPKSIPEIAAGVIESAKNGDIRFIVMVIAVASVILSFNGIETWGVCGLLGIVASVFGIKLANKAMDEADNESTILKVGKIIAIVGLAAGIVCLVIGVLVGVIAALAAKANA